MQAPKKRKADDPNNKDEEQIVPLANERFMVPETLFHPSDIGVNQMGIAEALVHAVRTHSPTYAARTSSRACTNKGPHPGAALFDTFRYRRCRAADGWKPDEGRGRASR